MTTTADWDGNIRRDGVKGDIGLRFTW